MLVVWSYHLVLLTMWMMAVHPMVHVNMQALLVMKFHVHMMVVDLLVMMMVVVVGHQLE
jgi:hypothetical protein